MNDTLIWLGIVLCLTQSAMLSGVNLAVFSLSRLRLETVARGGDRQAIASSPYGYGGIRCRVFGFG